MKRDPFWSSNRRWLEDNFEQPEARCHNVATRHTWNLQKAIRDKDIREQTQLELPIHKRSDKPPTPRSPNRSAPMDLAPVTDHNTEKELRNRIDQLEKELKEIKEAKAAGRSPAERATPMRMTIPCQEEEKI